MVGRIAQEKGPHLFAEAANQLGCEAVFIGDGDQRADVLRRLPFGQDDGLAFAGGRHHTAETCQSLGISFPFI